MQTRELFIEAVIRIAKERGFRMEINRDGLRQIDFIHKKLHEDHLSAMWPDILAPNANLTAIFKKAAPGRPCAYSRMREIIPQLKTEWELT